MKQIIHDIRNELAVAIATVHAMSDGKLPPTQANLQGLLEALDEANALVSRLRLDPPAAPRAEDGSRT